MRRKALAAAALLLALVWSTPEIAVAGGQVSIWAGGSSGDYGTGADTENQSATVQFTQGDETQVRLEFEMRRASSALGISQTPFGPVPDGRKGPPGSGAGSGPGNGSGGGASPSSAALDTSPEIAAVNEWNTGPGDLRLKVSRLLRGGGAKLFRLDLEAGAKIPTANEEDRLGTGEWDYRLGLSGQYRFWSAAAFGGVGWNALGDPEWAELSDVLDAFIGLESQPLADRVIVSGWLEANEEVVAGTGSRTALGVGVRGTGKLGWRVQIGTGISGSAEDFSARFGVTFGVDAPTIGSRRVG